MPVHRVSSAPGHLEKYVADLERTESIVSVVTVDETVLVFTVVHPTVSIKETRG